MKIDCNECGARIWAEDIDLPSKMAKCRACQAVFSFAARMHSAEMARPRTRTPRPEGLEVREILPPPTEPGYRDAPRRKGMVTITWRWYSPVFIFLLFFCALWDSFLFMWYSNLGNAGPLVIVFVLFPVVHVAIGVGLTYFTIAGFINKTTLTLDEHHLSVRHGPLLWKGNHTLAREEIRQLYCEHELSQGKNGPRHTYHLSAMLADGSKVQLAQMAVGQAKYLEELLEGHVGIEDEQVPGEVGSRSTPRLFS